MASSSSNINLWPAVIARDHEANRNETSAPLARRGLCRAVLKGISDQMRADGLLKNGCYGVQVADDDLAVLEAKYGPNRDTAAGT